MSCFVLHQQASRLEKELEMHHGFYLSMTSRHRDVGCFQLDQFGGDYSAAVASVG